jgi:hypothetical protein
VGQNGADLISFNTLTKQVTFWDAKFRSAVVVVKQSKTFVNTATRENCIQEAIQYINSSQSPLTAAQKAEALQSIRNETYQLRTIGQGNAKTADFIFQ